LLTPFLLKKAFGYKIGYKDGIKKGGCFHTRPRTFIFYAACLSVCIFSTTALDVIAFNNRINSRSSAVRQLIEAGLATTKTKSKKK